MRQISEYSQSIHRGTTWRREPGVDSAGTGISMICSLSLRGSKVIKNPWAWPSGYGRIQGLPSAAYTAAASSCAAPLKRSEGTIDIAPGAKPRGLRRYNSNTHRLPWTLSGPCGASGTWYVTTRGLIGSMASRWPMMRQWRAYGAPQGGTRTRHGPAVPLERDT
eukprot:4944209-Prymnesium_polylepis.1